MPADDGTRILRVLSTENRAVMEDVASISYQLARTAVDVAALLVWRSEVEQLERERCRGHLQLLACSAGCSSCCNIEVEAQPFEALLVHRTGAQWAANAVTNSGATATRRGACPVLRDNRCGAYGSRPTACRAQNSYSATACAVDGGTHMYAAEVKALPRFALAGAMRAFVERGLDCYPVILGPALATLSGKDADTLINRWLAGETIFPQSVRAPWVNPRLRGRLRAQTKRGQHAI